MKKADQFQRLNDKKVKCSLCNHRCTIEDKRTGVCGVRYNKAGTLYSLYYGKPIALHIDPIEKKPLYHFLKGTSTYSFGTLGCNFRCDWCQNWEISQRPRDTRYKISRCRSRDPDLPSGQDTKKLIKFVSPQEIVIQAKKTKCPSISYTYTEPTIFFEYALDTMKLAHKEGLKNIWVSNGYFTEECFKEIEPYLDAINVDLKGFNDKIYQKYCGARLQPVLDNLRRIKKARHIHLEITTLIIPGINDDEQQLQALTNFIAQKIGKETPLHLSRFFPCYKMTDTPPTPILTLKKAESIGQKAGLKYIYLGNV